MDDATADLVLTLQFEDLCDLREQRFSEHTNRGYLDAEIALQIYQDQLREQANRISDHLYSQRIGEADELESPPASPLPSATPRFDQAYNKRRSRCVDSVNFAPAESHLPDSAASQDRRKPERQPTLPCVICGDATAKDDLMTAPCGHEYCAHCINKLFTFASRDESLFPPSCCKKEITLEQARRFLESSVYEGFKQKSEEFSTTNRVYCFKSDCGAFISPNDVDGDRATCKICLETTCAICQAAMHDGDCPQDPAVQSMLKASADAGFRQCYDCKRMIELEHGCFHMACYCRAEFCYSCGAKWKQCACVMWDEERLLIAAEELVEQEDQDAGGAAPVNLEQAAQQLRHFQDLFIAHELERADREVLPPIEQGEPIALPHQNLREVAVLGAMRRIQVQEECEHQEWYPVGVRGRNQRGIGQQCDICHLTLGRYLLKCTHCRMRACVRCRRNRL